MAPSTSSTLTIQPWTQNADKNNNLQDVLARAQRGHLRDITEASLQEEIAAEGALELSDESSSEDSEADEDENAIAKKNGFVHGKPSTREDLFRAKHYMLHNIAKAKAEVEVSLDLMSLLISKDNPQAARTTMSVEVKERVPAGTIWVDFWQRMPADEARLAQDALLAANVKMEGLQGAADALLGAAKRMEESVRRETQYWDQLLAVSGRGWNVCRVPGQQYRLGVRFGFSESAGQFSRKGIVALNPDSDGGIRLERGIGSKPRGLRAVLRRKGEVVGASRLPAVRDADETTLEARIRHARDSLFDEELYHEMIRESRTLTSLGVAVEGSSVHMRNVSDDSGGDNLEVSFDLVPLNEDNSLDHGSNEQNNLADATMLAARLLLSQAHRDRLRKRSEPPPPISEKQKDDNPVLPILRPLLSLMLHHTALAQLTAYITTLSRTLTAANIDHLLDPPSLQFPQSGNASPTITTAETLLTNTLLRPLTSTGTLAISSVSTADSTERLQPPPQAFTLALSTAGNTPVFTLTAPAPGPSSQTYHFTDFRTFASSTSSLLASSLSSALLPHVQNDAGEWKVRENEAVLEQDAGVGEMERRFALVLDVDGEHGRLEMVFTGRERRDFSWSGTAADADVDDEAKEKEKEGLLEACKSCLT